QLALEELRRAADSAERVLDLVGEVADELAVGRLLLEDLRLARDLELLLELAQLQQQPRLRRLDRADHAVQVQPLARHLERELVLVEPGIRFDRLREPLEERLVAGERPVERRADEVPESLREERFRRGIRVGDAQVFVEQQHGGRQELEARERAAHRGGRDEPAKGTPAARAGASAQGECRKGELLEATASARRAPSGSPRRSSRARRRWPAG